MTESLIDHLNTPSIPTLGSITVFDHKRVPKGWTLVTGQSLSKLEYPEVYEKLGGIQYGYAQEDSFTMPILLTPHPEFTGYYFYTGTQNGQD